MKLFFYRLLFLFSLGILFPVYKAQATHLRASEIRVERLNCTSLTFLMTVTAYTNTAPIVRFSDQGSGVLDFGDVSNGFVDLVEQKKKCARFVSKVDFKVFNRWGKHEFDHQSGNGCSIYIDWGGQDNDGKELAAGIYDYHAAVIFDVVNPSQRNQSIKGWGHLIR